MPDGNPVSAGDTIKNPAYAETLSAIAGGGAGAFYEQQLAASIVERAAMPPAGSSMSTVDLASYRAIEREPVCGDFRVYSICSVPPPSSGIAVISMAVLYDHLLGDMSAGSEDKLSVFVDAQRLAYADRDHFIADPAFADVPVDALLNPAYLEKRASQRFGPSDKPVKGDPLAMFGESARRISDGTMVTGFGTTHLSIIDRDGNAVSMTASVGFPFGSLRMSNGFFLNNELTDFSTPDSNAAEVKNSVAAGKRPRSSMSPTIIFDRNGQPLMLTGSAGGSSILAYIAKTILAVLDWDLSAQEAVDFPNVIARGESVGVEVSAPGGEQIAADLEARGFAVTEGRGENSGLHVIVVRPDGLEGAADSRRHGTVGQLK